MGARLTILTPIDLSAARPVGNGFWEKRILPIGEINYKGRKLSFTPSYLSSLVTSFNSQAYNQVPFQLADAQNTHTNDPERFRGEIHSMRLGDDGLYIKMKPTARGTQVLTENPKLGVSARIVEEYERADGKFFPAAVQHVLGTLDPRIPDLGPWKYVEMSNDAGQVYDLSDVEIAGEDTGMAGLTQAQQARLDRLLSLSDEQLDALLGVVDTDTDGEYDEDELTDEELAALVDELDAEDLDALQDEFEAEQLAGAGAGPSLSNFGGDAVELANIQLAETNRQLGVMRRKMDADSYELEKQKLTRNGGLPPYIVDMARPLLEGSGHVVELANGEGVDAGLVMRRVLAEMGRLTSMLDLSSEQGSTFDEPDITARGDQARTELVARYRNQTGL